MSTLLKSFNKTMAASATAEPLSSASKSSTFIKIKALSTNTQPVLIGDSTGQTYPLAANSELQLSDLMTPSGGARSINLADIYAKAGANGEGVSVIFLEDV